MEINKDYLNNLIGKEFKNGNFEVKMSIEDYLELKTQRVVGRKIRKDIEFEIGELELILIKEYTEWNFHNESLMLQAIRQERYDLLKQLADIKTKHLEDGFMSEENINKRNAIEQELK